MSSIRTNLVLLRRWGFNRRRTYTDPRHTCV